MLVKRCSVSVLHPTNWGSSIFPMTILECCLLENLGGGFKYYLFSSLFGEMIQFDYIIFFKGVETTT